MRRLVIFTILMILVFGFAAPKEVFALTIGPPKFKFSADPGDVVTGSINMRNNLGNSSTWYSTFVGLTVRGSHGEPVFLEDKTDLATWIETAPSVTIGPQETVSVPFSITVPEDAEPGGHYAAIFWGTAPPKAAGIGVVSQLAVLILLNVSGNVIEEGEVQNFHTKGFSAGLPLVFSFVFVNTGTVHQQPSGEIAIKNLFGRATDVLKINKGGDNVLPKTEREFSVGWQPKDAHIESKGFFADLKREWSELHWGPYKAELNLEYGETEEKSLQAKTMFWILPWRFLLVSAIILAILALGLGTGIKAYNHWIISKVQQTYQKKKDDK